MTIRRYSLIAALAICIGAVVFLAYRFLALQVEEVEENTEVVSRRFQLKQPRTTVHLYFSNMEHRFLTAEDRSLALPDNVVERARVILNALIDGPEGHLTPTLPDETGLLALYVTSDGVAYVDFDRGITEKHPGGSLSELLSVFSIVNTLCLNIPQIEAVKILIEGRGAETLAGHIDIRPTFRPNLLIIK